MYILLQFNDLLTKKVIKYVLLIAALMPLPGSAYSFQLTLAWDANYEPDLAGYTVHYGTVSRNYEFSVDVGKYESVVVSGLEIGKTYYFAVTAYDIDQNESDFSTELPYKVHGLKSSPWIPLLLLDD
jgi:hypothetical protein